MCEYVAILSSANGILGDADNNSLVVHDKEDMKWFKETTTKMGIVVMGRKTIESLPKKLTNRITVCLTTNKKYKSDKADVVLHSVEDVRAFCHRSGKSKIAICGGAKVYEAFAEYIDSVIVTHFDVDTSGVKNPIYTPLWIIEAMDGWPSITKHQSQNGRVVTEYRRGVSITNEKAFTYPEGVIVKNALQTPDGTVIQSHHVHDYVSHVDEITGDQYFVDGGLDYMRRSTYPCTDLSVTTQDHSVARHYLMWTTAQGVTKSVSELTTPHINAILNTQNRIAGKMRMCLVYELLLRTSR